MMVPPANQPGHVRCSQCGARNPNGALFCETCGELLEFNPPPPASEDDTLPDWLGAAAPQQPPQPTADQVPTWAQETEPGSRIAGVPDWLSAAQAQEDAPEPPADLPGAPPEPTAAEPTPEADIPDWLRAASSVSADEPAAPPEPEDTQPHAPETDVPEWLADLASGAAEDAPADVSGDEADWLAELDALASPEPAPPPDEPAAAPPPPRDDLPDWLRSAALPVDEPGATAEPAPPVPGEPEGPWAAGEPAPDDEPDTPRPVNPVAWLTSPSPDDVVDAPVADLPGWLNGEDFDEAEGEAAGQPAGEDLLGLDSPLEATPGDSAQPVGEVDASDLPDWMHALEGTQPDDQIRLTMPLQNLRYEAISQELPEEPVGPEPVGALKNVTGVIRPEMLFEASSLAVERPVERLIITDRQAEQVQRIAGLLAEEGRPVQVAGGRAGRLPLLEWVIAAVMVIVVGLSLLAEAPLFPAAAAPGTVADAYGVLDTLAAGGATVLVVFDYEPDTAAEMQPLAEVILRHLAGGESATVYAISTRAAGPAMAEAVLSQPALSVETAARGGTWQNLGYLSGEASGIHGLAVGAMPGTVSPLAFNTLGQPTGLSFDRLAGSPVDAIVVLAARPEDLRAWVEQAGRSTGLPLVAAVSARAAPLAAPYHDSGQLAGMLTGLNDAVAYGGLAGQQAGGGALTLWNAQVIGAMTAAALIVIGGLFYGLAGRIRQERPR